MSQEGIPNNLQDVPSSVNVFELAKTHRRCGHCQQWKQNSEFVAKQFSKRPLQDVSNAINVDITKEKYVKICVTCRIKRETQNIQKNGPAKRRKLNDASKKVAFPSYTWEEFTHMIKKG